MRMKPGIREIIVVEGRYDKNTVLQAVDATVVETGGFGVFSDRERAALIRLLARERGVVILTDPDSAGFLIRSRIKGMLRDERVLNAYVPDIYGRERRKTRDSKEGKLGVEGMRPEVIVEALRLAGATFEAEENAARGRGGVTKADFYELGLSGAQGSRARRAQLAGRLGLPERISANGLLEVVNACMSREELTELLGETQ